VERSLRDAIKRIRASTTQEVINLQSEPTAITDLSNNPIIEIGGEVIVDNNQNVNPDIDSNLVSTTTSNSLIKKHCNVNWPSSQTANSKLYQLGEWATKYNIRQNALADLLRLCREWLPFERFPKDPRTLLGTPKQLELTAIDGGMIHHFGIEKRIRNIINNSGLAKSSMKIPDRFSDYCNLLTLKIGVDGLPISKSSNKQFWPILGKLDQDPLGRIFIISLFYGSEKPQDLESYLGPFVNEVLLIENTGIIVGDTKYCVRIRCLSADAPARSFLKQTKGHNAYFGCEKCYRRGSYKNFRITYPMKDPAELYTDTSFRERWYQPHHKILTPSPLEKLDFGMISQMPLDYMHLCLLGITKKFLLIWCEGKRPHKMSLKQKQIVSTRLESYRPYISRNFSRKCRGLNELKHWKATEFRLFLLYVGPVALRKVLSKEKYENFLLFHTAIYILSQDLSMFPEWLNYAEGLITSFVSQIKRLYSADILIYNVHSLLHLANDVRLHGALDNFSAFEFESFMFKLKRLLRSNSSQLSQIVKRVSELEKFEKCVDSEHGYTMYANSNPSDNCFLTNDQDYIMIVEVLNGNNFKCRKFSYKENVKSYPCESSSLGIHVVKDLSLELLEVNSSQFRKKCVLIPMKNEKFYVIPMCNAMYTL